MMHTEWDVAATCEIGVLDAASANVDLSPDEPVAAPFVLVLGGSGGGALVVEGSRAELLAFLGRAYAATEWGTR